MKGTKLNNYNATQIAPCIYVYENVIDNCDELIALARGFDKSKITEAKIGKDLSLVPEYRSATLIDISAVFSNDIEWFVIAKKIWEYGNQYAIENLISFSNMEYLQFLHYKKNDGFYKKHVDAGPGSIDRIFSAVLYLNDIEKGGETYFNKFDVSVHPKKGRLALFPANYAYEHEAKTPISNEKNVIVTWFRS